MSRHRKRQFRLTLTGAFHTNDQQCARIQNGGQGCKPGLVVMLRVKKGQRRVGEMALEEFCGPSLPLMQQLL